jgi:hypothetical protein
MMRLETQSGEAASADRLGYAWQSYRLAQSYRWLQRFRLGAEVSVWTVDFVLGGRLRRPSRPRARPAITSDNVCYVALPAGRYQP